MKKVYLFLWVLFAWVLIFTAPSSHSDDKLVGPVKKEACEASANFAYMMVNPVVDDVPEPDYDYHKRYEALKMTNEYMKLNWSKRQIDNHIRDVVYAYGVLEARPLSSVFKWVDPQQAKEYVYSTCMAHRTDPYFRK